MIEQIYTLLSAGKRAAALDLVYDTLDDLLLASKFAEVRDIIRDFPLTDSLPLSIYLSILIITRPWKEFLPERELIREFCIGKIDIGFIT